MVSIPSTVLVSISTLVLLNSAMVFEGEGAAMAGDAQRGPWCRWQSPIRLEHQMIVGTEEGQRDVGHSTHIDRLQAGELNAVGASTRNARRSSRRWHCRGHRWHRWCHRRIPRWCLKPAAPPWVGDAIGEREETAGGKIHRQRVVFAVGSSDGDSRDRGA